MDNQNLTTRVSELERQLAELKSEYYSGNFSSRQDFTKFCDFRYRLKIPHYSATPTTVSEVGEIIEVGGIVYVCTATTPTWTKVGTQS